MRGEANCDSAASTLIALRCASAWRSSWAVSSRSRSREAASWARSSERRALLEFECEEASAFPFWVRARSVAFSCSSSATRLSDKGKIRISKNL